MTWDTAKLIRGKAYVQEIEIHLDACKYTLAPYTTYNLIEIGGGGSYSSSHTGATTLFSSYPDHVATWGGGTLHLKSNVNGETITGYISGAVLTIVARGVLGSTAATINSGDTFTIKHLGDADNSCRGYPHDCSSVDSYLSTAKKIPVWATAPSSSGKLRFSGLKKVVFDDGEVDIGETIGKRSSLSFEISDETDNDYFFNPYPDKRSTSGTMFGKLLARHPYLEGRKVIYREGLRDPYSLDEPDWIEREFVIDTYKLSDEKLSIKCLDPLVLTEDKKAKMPVASPARLLANLGTGGAGTTFNFYDAPDYYFGAMSSSIYVRIDSEVIPCTVSGATQLTVVSRGYRSTNKSHEAGASIQDCVRFAGTHIIDAIVFAMQNYTSIPSGYFNLSAYDDIKALMPTYELDDYVISKPTAVVDFINEMIKVGNLGLYFDSVNSAVEMIYIPIQEIEPIVITEGDHIKRGSVSIDDNVKNQYTRFSVLWALTDITSDQQEKFAVNYLSINAGLESDSGMGQVNERKSQKLPCLSGSVDDSLLGAAYSARIISENEEKPKIAIIKLDAKDVGATQAGELKKGSIISLSTKYNQDKDGNNLAELYQVRAIDGNGFDSYQIKLNKFQFIVSESIDFTISTGGINYDLSDFYTPTAGAYTIYIEPGVEFGSYDASLPAFTTGAQSPGVSFTIINAGKILGMGGAGGDSGLIADPDPKAGEGGGDALDVTVPLTIKNASGLIWAGGAGGTSMNYVPITPGGPVPRNGGGGGQGYGTSIGGYNSDGVNHTTRAASGSQSSGGSSPYCNGAPWGEDAVSLYSGLFGVGGAAIRTNGNAVIILSGNNDLNIKGYII